MNIVFIEKGKQDIRLIEILWSKLNKIHSDTSSFFSKEYISKSFDERVNELLNKTSDGIIKIFIAKDTEANCIIGYCVCTIVDKTGEIDSIFVENAYRKMKIGDTFLLKADDFFNHNSVTRKRICVYAGNELVINFYNRHHYYQKYIILEKKEENQNENSLAHY